MEELSKENKSKIKMNHLYKAEPKEGEKTWCRNWTFYPRETSEGKIFMIDTYFDNDGMQVTDKNIGRFTEVFDKTNVVRVVDDFVPHYEPEDLFRVATDSGGWTCGNLYWKNRDTKKSAKRMIENKEQLLNNAKREVINYEREIEQLRNGTHYDLK